MYVISFFVCLGLSDLEPESGMLEMIPPSVRERLVRLEHENKRLKQQQSSSVNGGGMQQVSFLFMCKRRWHFSNS